MKHQPPVDDEDSMTWFCLQLIEEGVTELLLPPDLFEKLLVECLDDKGRARWRQAQSLGLRDAHEFYLRGVRIRSE